jgi:hypothetical protein
VREFCNNFLSRDTNITSRWLKPGLWDSVVRDTNITSRWLKPGLWDSVVRDTNITSRKPRLKPSTSYICISNDTIPKPLVGTFYL